MYDAQTRELYATMFKTAEAALQQKLAAEIASVVQAHPVIAAQLGWAVGF